MQLLNRLPKLSVKPRADQKHVVHYIDSNIEVAAVSFVGNTISYDTTYDLPTLLSLARGSPSINNIIAFDGVDEQGVAVYGYAKFSLAQSNYIAQPDMAQVNENNGVSVNVVLNDSDPLSILKDVWFSFETDINQHVNYGLVYGLSIQNNQIVFAPTAFSELYTGKLMEGQTKDVVIAYKIEDAQGNIGLSNLTVTVSGTNGPSAARDVFKLLHEHEIAMFDPLHDGSTTPFNAQSTMLSLTDVFVLTSDGINRDSAHIENNQIKFDPSFALADLAVGESEYVTVYYGLADQFGAKTFGSYLTEVQGVM